MTSASSPPSSASVQELVPPVNFAIVCPGVYRSGYPTKKNYPFLRALRLRTILYLCPEEYAETNLKFCEENSIAVLRFPTEGNKEPFTDIAEPLMHRILSTLVDTRNHPVLIHCNKGKHRTGAVCGCLRLLQGWSLVSIFREYKAFSASKARVSDQTYIELYYPIVRIHPPHIAPWLSVSPRTKIVFCDRDLIEGEAAQLGVSLLAPMPKPGKPSKKNKSSQETGGGGGGGETTTTATTPGSPSASASISASTALSGGGGGSSSGGGSGGAAASAGAGASVVVPTTSGAVAGAGAGDENPLAPSSAAEGRNVSEDEGD